MSVRRDYKNIPTRSGKNVFIQVPRQQQQRAMNQLGFIQGGRFLRSPILQQRLRAQQQGKLSVEVKGVDTDVTTGTTIVATTSTNADIVALNLVQQGAGSWNRVGRKVRLKSLRIKGVVKMQNIVQANLQQNTLRMIVVWDKQPSSGAVPTFDTIFGATDQGGVEQSGFLYNIRYDNTERFSILKDQVWTSDLETGSGINTNDWATDFDCFIKLKNMVTVFSGQSNPMTIADVSSGALYVIWRCQTNSATVTAQVNNSVFRLRYYDN